MKAVSFPSDIHGKVMLSSASHLNKTQFPPLYVMSELMLTEAVHSPVKRDETKAVSVQAEIVSSRITRRQKVKKVSSAMSPLT